MPSSTGSAISAGSSTIASANAPTMDSFIQSHMHRQRTEIYTMYASIANHSQRIRTNGDDLLAEDNAAVMTVGDLTGYLKSFHGLDAAKNDELQTLLQAVIEKIGRHPVTSHAKSGKQSLQKISLHEIQIAFNDFYQLMTAQEENIIQRALLGKLAISHWHNFCEVLTSVYDEVVSDPESAKGRPAQHVPELADIENPQTFAVAVCTVDGQWFTIGDTEVEFALQSISTVFNLCDVADDIGWQELHKYLGFEPTPQGSNFKSQIMNSDESGRPANPLINSGAIVVCSQLEPQLNAAKRYEHMNRKLSEFAGGAQIGFDNSMFLSEKSASDFHYAIAYNMRECGVLSKNVKIDQTMDLYFQSCCQIINPKRLSMMASTLANAGISPFTGKRVVTSETVKHVLQLMLSCGLYDYSGAWSTQVGLPAKSSASGCIVVVVPQTLGLVVYSPRLDKNGNSVRGINFCTKASKLFGWSIFDRLVPPDQEEEEELRRSQAQRLSVSPISMAEELSPSTSHMSQQTERDMSISSAVSNLQSEPSYPPKRNTNELLDQVDQCQAGDDQRVDSTTPQSQTKRRRTNSFQ